MTIASPETAGPNITSGTEIKFSTLRKYFLKMKPRSSFTDSDTFEPETGSVSASQLLRVSSLDSIDDGLIEEEYELASHYLLPYVPDCTENSNIATENDWKPSQFVGSIKYYYLGQSTTDDLNLNLSSQSWNSNLPLNIRKWFFVDGTIGSNTNADGTKSDPSLIISSTANYLTLKLSSTGRIYGSAGAAGTNGVNGGKGGDGGDAIYWIDDNSLYNNYIILHPDSRLYAGGGGGGKGGNGGKGGTGGKGGNHNIGCNGIGAGGFNCHQNGHGGGAGGATKIGPNGPAGRGYSNLTGSITPNPGGVRNYGRSGGCYHVGCQGSGGNSGTNGNSGSAGDFGKPGNSVDSTNGTGGLGGHSGSLQGHCAVCGGNKLGHHNRCCHTMSTSAQGGEQPGTSGAEGGSGGKAILKGTTTSFTVVGGGTDSIKGDDQPINYALSDFYQFVPYSVIPDGTSNILLLVRDKDTIDTVEQSISVDMNVVCDTQGIISQFTRITEIERFNFNQIAVTVTPSFNAFNTGPEFNFYS